MVRNLLRLDLKRRRELKKKRQHSKKKKRLVDW